MIVKKVPENGQNFVEYSEEGTKVSFGDGEIMVNLEKKERDDDVKIDVCMDYLGGLTFGTAGAKFYVAQIYIPARTYTDAEVDNPYYNEEDEFSQQRIVEHRPDPFNMEKVELTLFNQEV